MRMENAVLFPPTASQPPARCSTFAAHARVVRDTKCSLAGHWQSKHDSFPTRTFHYDMHCTLCAAYRGRSAQMLYGSSNTIIVPRHFPAMVVLFSRAGREERETVYSAIVLRSPLAAGLWKSSLEPNHRHSVPSTPISPQPQDIQACLHGESTPAGRCKP